MYIIGLDLLLNPADWLNLVAVGLGAVLIVVSVFSFIPVPLKDVLVSTVTRELVGHPAEEAEGRRNKVSYGRD